MNIWTSVIVFVVAVTMVESCWHLNFLRRDFSKKCDHWFRKASSYEGHRNRSIRRCVILVQNKCPETMTMTTGKIEKRVYKHYTKWTVQKIATYIKTGATVKFIKTQKRGVCADDDGGPGNCDFWWRAAIWKDAETHMVARCVGQVLKNCPDLLVLLEDKTEHQKKYRGDRVDVQHLKYRHKNGQEVTFRKYHFQSVGPKYSSK